MLSELRQMSNSSAANLRTESLDVGLFGQLINKKNATKFEMFAKVNSIYTNTAKTVNRPTSY